MLSNDSLENEIKDLRHPGSVESRQRIWAEVRRALDEEQEQQAAYKQPQKWRIIMKGKITKYAAAVVIMIGVLVTISFFGGSPDGAGVAWARVAKTYNDVREIKDVTKLFNQEGSIDHSMAYVRKPDCVYAEFSENDEITYTLCGRGQEGLRLDHRKKRAIIWENVPDSVQLDYSSFNLVGLFNDKPMEGVTIRRLDEESDDRTIIFFLKIVEHGDVWEGKAWVDAASNLPKKLRADLITETRFTGKKVRRVEIDFSYDPISDDVFEWSMEDIPAGYTISRQKDPGKN